MASSSLGTEVPDLVCSKDRACACKGIPSPWPVVSVAPCRHVPHAPTPAPTRTPAPHQAWAAADLGVSKGKTEYDASALVVLLDEVAEVAGACRAGLCI